MPTTTAPTYCPACGGDEPPGLPIHSDELGPYVICPTCDGSHDICTESHDLDAPHILPEDYPLPSTRQLTDTERVVLRGMLP